MVGHSPVMIPNWEGDRCVHDALLPGVFLPGHKAKGVVPHKRRNVDVSSRKIM